MSSNTNILNFCILAVLKVSVRVIAAKDLCADIGIIICRDFVIVICAVFKLD